MKILIFLILLLGGWTTTTNAIQTEWPKKNLPINENKQLVAEFVGEISKYTAGRYEENDSEPCIGAWNNDICQMVREGKLVFANNYYKNGTIVCIDKVGCGEVRDRMNKRYGQQHFDIAGLNLQDNLEFGRQKLVVRVYKK